MADMNDIHFLAALHNAEDYTIDIGLAAVEQLSEVLFSGVTGQRLGVFRRLRMASLSPK